MSPGYIDMELTLRTNACVVRNVPLRLMSTTESHAASSSLTIQLSRVIPAQLTRMLPSSGTERVGVRK